MARSRLSGETEASFRAAAKEIARAAKSFKGITPMALRMFGEEIMADVKASRPGHGVPVDKGILRGTGMVTPRGNDEKPEVVLSFGGAAAPYALYQHEITTYKHTVGEPRYLVRGVERWRARTSAAYQALVEEAKRILGGHGGRR